MSLSGKASGKAKGDILRGNIRALKTLKGYSAYEVALINGFEGTEEEWLASLKGEKGDPQIFIAEYGVTSFVDVFDAFWRGSKICFCKKDEMVLPVRHVDTVMHIDGSSKVIFGGFFEGEYHEWTVSGNVTSFTWAESCETPTSDFVVTFEQDEPYTADKTFEEVKAAYEAGRTIIGVMSGLRYEMYSDGGGEGFGFIHRVTSDLSYKMIWLWEGDSVTFSSSRIEISHPEEVFIAEYGVTGLVHVYNAINAGKVCFAKNGTNILPLTNYTVLDGAINAFYFSGYANGKLVYYCLKSSSAWTTLSRSFTSTISEASTSYQIPTAKAVYDALQNVGGGVDEAVDMSPLTVSLSVDDIEFDTVSGYYESLTDEEKAYFDMYRFLGDDGGIIVTLNYDDIYAALKAGRTVRIKLPKKFCVDNEHWVYPVSVVTAYGLTPFGLSVRTINASYIFTEGSSHRTDLDPGATYDDTE